MGLVSAARNILVTILFWSFSKSKYCYQFFHGFREFFKCILCEIVFHFVTHKTKCFQFCWWWWSPTWCVFRNMVIKTATKSLTLILQVNTLKYLCFFREHTFIITTYQPIPVEIFWFSLYHIHWNRHSTK